MDAVVTNEAKTLEEIEKQAVELARQAIIKHIANAINNATSSNTRLDETKLKENISSDVKETLKIAKASIDIFKLIKSISDEVKETLRSAIAYKEDVETPLVKEQARRLAAVAVSSDGKAEVQPLPKQSRATSP